MSDKIIFENHFSARVLEIFFPEGYVINTLADISLLKNSWAKNLKSWHFPYTCIFDLRNFIIHADMHIEFNKMIAFFSNFFMKKIIGFCDLQSIAPKVNFEIIAGYENARAQTGLNKNNSMIRDLSDLRAKIKIENDFNAHVMEISFIALSEFNTIEDINILKDKIKNILRQWHTPYSILFDCSNCLFSTAACKEFALLEKFLLAFFCKKILGYAPVKQRELYPFFTYRSRHLAAAQLENNGLKSGDKANCRAKK